MVLDRQNQHTSGREKIWLYSACPKCKDHKIWKNNYCSFSIRVSYVSLKNIKVLYELQNESSGGPIVFSVLGPRNCAWASKFESCLSQTRNWTQISHPQLPVLVLLLFPIATWSYCARAWLASAGNAEGWGREKECVWQVPAHYSFLHAQGSHKWHKEEWDSLVMFFTFVTCPSSLFLLPLTSLFPSLPNHNKHVLL